MSYREPFVIAHPGSVWYPPKDSIVAVMRTWDIIMQQHELPIDQRLWSAVCVTLRMPATPEKRYIEWHTFQILN